MLLVAKHATYHIGQISRGRATSAHLQHFSLRGSPDVFSCHQQPGRHLPHPRTYSPHQLTLLVCPECGGGKHRGVDAKCWIVTARAFSPDDDLEHCCRIDYIAPTDTTADLQRHYMVKHLLHKLGVAHLSEDHSFPAPSTLFAPHDQTRKLPRPPVVRAKGQFLHRCELKGDERYGDNGHIINARRRAHG